MPVNKVSHRENPQQSGLNVNNINYEEIKKFIKLVEKSDINELEILQNGVTLRIRKDSGIQQKGAVLPSGSVYSPPTVQLSPVEVSTVQVTPPSVVETIEQAKNTVEIRSPMVGTFYRAAAPGAEPFIHTGDLVEPGKVLCIIEAMKLMNEIECEVSGKIIEICAENGKPVEYGQMLFKIEPNI